MLHFLTIVIIIIMSNTLNGWQMTVNFDNKIENYINSKDDYRVFESVYLRNDYFALLASKRNNYIDSSQGYMMIGARNYLYRLSLPSLNLISSISWSSSQFDQMQCLNRSIINNKEECDNYIKLYQHLNDYSFRICSTNALNPKCRFYHNKEEILMVSNETSGLGYSPLRGFENKYVYNYIDANNYLFTANTIDLNRYFTSINKETDQDRISTNMHDNNWLHRADFVNSFKTDERIFFLFNEDTTNDDSEPINNRPARRVPSIAHICLNDQGAAAPNSLRNIWTTYLKTKLSCVYDTSKSYNSKQDAFKFDSAFQISTNLFYFDELKSISELYTKHDSENNKNITYFYAVFTTSKYSITASAVCMFTLDQIMTSFHGDYKQKEDHLSQNEMNSNLKHTKSNTMPVPKPSECPSKLTYQHLMFSRKNFIMQNEILSEALIVETSSQNRFQSIDTDFNINNNNDMDILFIGTDNGRVLTFVIENDQFQNDTEIKKKLIYSEELIVFNEEKKINFDYISTNQINKRSTTTNTSNNININEQDDNESILNIKFYKNETQQRRQFILTTKNRVLSIPANYCSLKSTANKCNSQLYPYCVWSKNINKCVDFDSINLDDATATNQDLFILISNSSLNNNETIITNLTSIDQLLIANNNNNTNLFLIQSFFDADNTKITISMNFILFILSIIAFLILSFLIGIATTYFIYIYRQKIQSKPSSLISKKKQNDNDFIVKINTNSITVNDIKRVVENTNNKLGGGADCSQLYSTVKSKNKRESVTNATSSIVSCSSSASSASSISPFGDSTTKSTLIDNDDPRYVYINNNKSQIPISILGISNLMINDQKFQDYDESEYFTLRKNKQFNNQTSVILPISADSSSSSSPNSAQTNTSTTKLVRHNNNNNNNTTNYEINNLNYYNRVLPTISVKCIEKHNNSSITTTTNNKKYYI